MDRAPEDFRVRMNGVWIPTESELLQLEFPRDNEGKKEVRYIAGRGAGVRVILGDKGAAFQVEVGKPHFAYIYAELRGQDRRLLRRTIRLYPDRPDDDGRCLLDNVALGKYQVVDLGWLTRPITAYEAGRALRDEEDDLFRVRVDGEPSDRVEFDRPSKKYLIKVDREVRVASSFDEAILLADYLSSLNPEIVRNDWRC